MLHNKFDLKQYHINIYSNMYYFTFNNFQWKRKINLLVFYILNSIALFKNVLFEFENYIELKLFQA